VGSLAKRAMSDYKSNDTAAIEAIDFIQIEVRSNNHLIYTIGLIMYCL